MSHFIKTLLLAAIIDVARTDFDNSSMEFISSFADHRASNYRSILIDSNDFVANQRDCMLLFKVFNKKAYTRTVFPNNPMTDLQPREKFNITSFNVVLSQTDSQMRYIHKVWSFFLIH